MSTKRNVWAGWATPATACHSILLGLGEHDNRFSLAQAFTPVERKIMFDLPFPFSPLQGAMIGTLFRISRSRPLKGAERKRK
jgi:hypothetical protein